jgi:SAM-dependent methyltransferase
LRAVCGCIEGQDEGSVSLLEKLCEIFSRDKAVDEIEKEAQDVLDLNGARRARLVARLDDRSTLIYGQIKSWITGDSILDFGCGDGKVGWKIKQASPQMNVDLYDVMSYIDPTVHLDGHIGPRNNSAGLKNAYDITLLLTVLHHCSDPRQVLEDVIRRTRKRLIIIESVFGVQHDRRNMSSNLLPIEQEFVSAPPHVQFMYAEFIDWFYNRVVHQEVNVPFNYDTPAGWSEQLSRYGTVVSTEMLGIDQPLVPEYHLLLVVDVNPLV